MTDRDQDLMERYIYEVTRRIPRGQREEIGMELRELIGDMLEEGRRIDEVLTSLGNPAEFAKKYQDDSHYLIGPEYFDNYIWVLKIVLICVGASVLLSAIVEAVIEGASADVVSAAADITEYFITAAVKNAIISGGFAVGIVTLVFAVLERQRVKVDIKAEKVWSVQNLEEGSGWLSPVPDKRALISRGESAVSLIFTVVFTGMLILVPQFVGAYVFEDGEIIRTIPVFNLEKWHMIVPFLVICLCVSFIDDMVKLVTGRYCYLVMAVNMISGGLQIIFSCIAIKVLPSWNVDFMQEVSEQFHWTAFAKGDLMHYWGTELFSNAVVGLVCFAVLMEVGITVYKTLRYGVRARMK